MFHFVASFVLKSLVNKHLEGVCLTCVCLCLFMTASTQAAPEIPKTSDIRLVIDISGSMKKNDPQNLRRPGVEMLVKLLPEGSKAGIWSFGQSVNLLVPHQKVDKRWGQKAISSSSRIQSNAQFTNIGEALEQAAYDHQSTSGSHQRHVILLTDGMVDIDRDTSVNTRERQRIIQSILPLYQQAGITLHTIALSDNADKQLLSKLALGTDGKEAVAKTAEELMNAFLQVFDQAVPAEEVPFDGNSFVVDSSIEEFTALIFRKPGAKDTQIISPDKSTYDKSTADALVNWHHTDKYDLITVKQPLEGEWQVSADLESQSRITVVSDLSLVVGRMPTNLTLNDTLSTTLALIEEGKPVTRVEFLGLLDIDFVVEAPDGTRQSQRLSQGLVPRDGVYPVRVESLDQEGEYNLRFTVDGKTFNRQYTHRLSVRQPFEVNVKSTGSGSDKQFIIDVIPKSQAVKVDQTSVVGDLQKPSGKSQILPFSSTPEGNWRLTVRPDKSGDYVLSINAKFSDNNEDFSLNLETVRLSTDGTTAINPEPPVTQETQPAVAEPETAEPETTEPMADTLQEKPVDNEESNMMDIILYSIIGVVNLLIIIVGFIIYRKMFKKTKDDKEPDNTDQEEVEGFTEPPMDEMAVEDLDEDEEDSEEELMDEPVDEEVQEPELDDSEAITDNEEELAIEGGDELDLDDESDEDEIPEFSLDEFSKDSLEDEDLDDPDKE